MAFCNGLRFSIAMPETVTWTPSCPKWLLESTYGSLIFANANLKLLVTILCKCLSLNTLLTRKAQFSLLQKLLRPSTLDAMHIKRNVFASRVVIDDRRGSKPVV
jgi:hypothetical protein